MYPSIIRPMHPTEYPQLEVFLYEAVFIPEGVERPGKEIVRLPELAVYYRDFGKKTGDLCLVAEWEGRLLGAVWIRLYREVEKGFGFVDAKTPELSMSVLEEFRQQGIGTALLQAMVTKMAGLGYKQVSLSVDLANYAYAWYLKFGFVQLNSDGHSATMLKKQDLYT